MKMFGLIGQIFFYTGIIGGFLLTIYYSRLLLRVSKEDEISINKLIFARRKPSKRWSESVNKMRYFGKILILLLGIGILCILASFIRQ